MRWLDFSTNTVRRISLWALPVAAGATTMRRCAGQSCTLGSACENPNTEEMVPLTQAIVTCNCEYKDEPAWASGAEPPAGNWGRAPPPEAFAGFVQDCTGPGAPVIIEIALSATIASTRSVEFLCQPPLVLLNFRHSFAVLRSFCSQKSPAGWPFTKTHV